MATKSVFIINSLSWLLQFWYLSSRALLQEGLMHLRHMRCWPHTKKLHMHKADYFLTCNCCVCLVIVRLIMLSCWVECCFNIYLSDHMLCNCFLSKEDVPTWCKQFYYILSHKWPLHVSDIYMSIFRSSFFYFWFDYMYVCIYCVCVWGGGAGWHSG